MVNQFEILEKKLFEFPVDLFIKRSAQDLATEIAHKRYRGIVLGASGGIDSLVTTALCLKAMEKRDKWKVVALQMNDSRIRGELYNTEMYRSLGADFMQTDITTEAIGIETNLGMPPRWFTEFLMKLVLRWMPTRVRRWLILGVISTKAPKWVLIHYQRLILLHRLRIVRLKEYASRNGLMIVICSNLTESSLGYFVEKGVDDDQMGDYAPLSALYKTQVIQAAQFMSLPENVIHQRPSPGFGGIYDEEIIGPYELVDLVLVGLQLGYSDVEITKAINAHASKSKKKAPFMRKNPFDINYVRFIRQLETLNHQKRHSESREDKNF
ncbi:MAG: hypothetical protein DRG73_01580 [Deltaproteobacteria bacterium]|nr:MAG: hypothetical protein DRG73_01580 [Deltaproteobacteria bacterium]